MRKPGAKTLIAVLSLSLFMAVALMPQAAGAQETSTLVKVTKSKVMRVGWANWKPWIYMDQKDRKIKGFATDLYAEMAKALGVKVKWVEDSWGTLVAALQANKIDIMVLGNKSFKRLLAAEYAGPITISGKSLILRNESIKKYNISGWRDADRPEVKIAVAMGSAADQAVTPTFKRAEIVRMQGDPQAVAALVAGRADAYSTDLSVLLPLAKEHKGLTVLEEPFKRAELGLYVRQGDQVFLNWVNWFIREMKINGKIEQWLKKHNIVGAKVAPYI